MSVMVAVWPSLQTVQILSHTCVLVLYDISQSPLVDDVLTYATQNYVHKENLIIWFSKSIFFSKSCQFQEFSRHLTAVW